MTRCVLCLLRNKPRNILSGYTAVRFVQVVQTNRSHHSKLLQCCADLRWSCGSRKQCVESLLFFLVWFVSTRKKQRDFATDWSKCSFESCLICSISSRTDLIKRHVPDFRTFTSNVGHCVNRFGGVLDK